MSTLYQNYQSEAQQQLSLLDTVLKDIQQTQEIQDKDNKELLK